jgi:methylmalonyl-CoA mutase, C-terminal domain
MPAKGRLLLAKTGLDCHDTGIVTVAQKLRDAGFEVIYLGLHNTPEQVVKAAIEEGVDAIGVSYLSGQHMPQMRKLLQAMHAANLQLPIFCGGVIPEEDSTALKAMGVAEVIPPGTMTRDVIAMVERALESKVATQSHRHDT